MPQSSESAKYVGVSPSMFGHLPMGFFAPTTGSSGSKLSVIEIGPDIPQDRYNSTKEKNADLSEINF